MANLWFGALLSQLPTFEYLPSHLVELRSRQFSGKLRNTSPSRHQPLTFKTRWPNEPLRHHFLQRRWEQTFTSVRWFLLKQFFLCKRLSTGIQIFNAIAFRCSFMTSASFEMIWYLALTCGHLKIIVIIIIITRAGRYSDFRDDQFRQLN